MDCRGFLEFGQLDEPAHDNLTQSAIRTDGWLGFFVIRECPARALMKLSILQKT